MIQAGIVVDNILRAMHRSDSDPDRANVWNLVNLYYYEFCRKTSFEMLRKRIDLDMTTSTGSAGLLLPANLFGIDMVRDEESKWEFYPRNYSAIEPEEHGYRYYTYLNLTEPAFESEDDCYVDQGSNSFSSDSLGATNYTGDYIQFSTEQGYYLLTGALTFTPKYWGPSVEGGSCRIRPRETRNIVIVDPSEEAMVDRTISVYYWSAPEPLYRDTDMILLPTSRALELSVLRAVPEAKERRPVSKGELDEALGEMLQLNPDFPRHDNPRDKHNSLFQTKSSMFGSR